MSKMQIVCSVLVVPLLLSGSALPLHGDEALPPNERGPYRVGHATVQPSTRPRTPTLDVWYPSESMTGGQPADYSRMDYVSNGAFEAIEVSRSQQWPLVLYLHAETGSPTNNFSLTEHLASHGFIVAAPQGELITTTSVIDLMLDPTAATVVDRVGTPGTFAGTINENLIGAVGFSAGGARVYTGAFDEPRIKAIMPIAPYGLGQRRPDPGVPALFLVGSRDEPVARSRAFETMETIPRYLGIIEDAGDYSFFDSCNTLFPGHIVCKPPYLPHAEVLDVLNLYGTAFFQTELNGRDEYASFLTPAFAEASLPVDFKAVVPPKPFTIVVPSEFADEEAPDVADGLPADYRLQQLYLAEEFQSLPPGKHLIARARWRTDGNLDVPQSVTADQWLLRMSTTSKSLETSLDSKFAENLGSDDTVVYDGPVEWQITDADPAGGPRDFEFNLEFQKAFPFDPRQGNLLLDATIRGGSTRLGLDFSSNATKSTTFIWTGNAGITDESQGITLGGHVVEYTFVSPDCNGDGLVDVSDANCASAATLDGTLALAGLLQGDVDGNGTVEFADFLVLSTNFGAPGRYTDGNLDKIDAIGFSDFLILSSNFGQSSAVLANVPEPTAGVLLALGLVCLSVRPRR